MGIRTQGCKPRLAEPADARTCHMQTHTHSKTHSFWHRHRDVGCIIFWMHCISIIQINSYVYLWAYRNPSKTSAAGKWPGPQDASTTVWVFQTHSGTSQTRRLSSDLVWQRDSSLGQPPGLLQFLCAIPPELPAQRVAHAGCLTVQCQPRAARIRGAGGGGGRRRHGLPGVHVAVLTLSLLQPFFSVPSHSPPAPKVGGAGWADRLETGCKDGGLLVWLHSPRHPGCPTGETFFWGGGCEWERSLGAEGELPVITLLIQTSLFQPKSREKCFMNLFFEFTSCSYQFVDGANPLVCFRLQSGVFLHPHTLNSDTSSL